MTWNAKGGNIICAFAYSVRMRVYIRQDPTLAQIAHANHEAFTPLPKEQRGQCSAQVMWHRPVFGPDDVPHPILIEDVVPGSISVEGLVRRCYPRAGVDLVSEGFRVAILPRGMNQVIAFLAGIARTQAAADAWVLNGTMEDLESKQEVPR